MKNGNLCKFVLFALFSSFLSMTYADDIAFDSFEEAQKAAEIREKEYDKRMAEHQAQINGAWEKQKADLGEDATYDISKITETRTTEQTSENAENTKLQNSVTDSINGLKQQMINTASANTVGFAGASAAYSWRVEYKNGKYILSDTYDEAMFVSGASGNTTTKTTSGGKSSNAADTDSTNDGSNPNGNISEPTPVPNAPTESNSEPNDGNNGESPTEDLPDDNQLAMASPNDKSLTEKTTEISKPDREVEIRVQHPTTFEEEVFTVTEGDEPKMLKLNKFAIPEDTRVKISAKANMEIDNTTLTMTIIDDEGESEPIDSASMKNYRHLFRIPSQDEYSVNIYVNEPGKQPKKIMQLALPVTSVDFGSRTISH
jgi:hypothetical protein